MIIFEECWPLGVDLNKDLRVEKITKILSDAATSQKQKDAAGLGSLAYELSKEELSIFSGSIFDQPIQLIANAINQPEVFWHSAKETINDEPQKRILVENAMISFKRAGWPWDRAFMLAAAYLATIDNIPIIKKDDSLICNEVDFPFWIAIDKHTQEGKEAIKEVSEKVGLNTRKVSWLTFYYSSAKENEILPSPWWRREMDWRLYKLGLSRTEAEKMWNRIKPYLFEKLYEKGEELRIHISSPHKNGIETNQLSFF